MTTLNRKLEGLPEKYLCVPKQGKPDIDAINCAILRAQALVALLHCQFEDEGCSRISNEMMVSALWGIDGYLDQLQAMCVRF